MILCSSLKQILSSAWNTDCREVRKKVGILVRPKVRLMTYGRINDFETEKMKIKPKDLSNLPISSKVIKYNCKQYSTVKNTLSCPMLGHFYGPMSSVNLIRIRSFISCLPAFNKFG